MRLCGSVKDLGSKITWKKGSASCLTLSVSHCCRSRCSRQDAATASSRAKP